MEFEELKRKALIFLQSQTQEINEAGHLKINWVVLQDAHDQGYGLMIDTGMMNGPGNLPGVRAMINDIIANNQIVASYSVVDCFLGEAISKEAADQLNQLHCSVEEGAKLGLAVLRNALILFIESKFERLIVYQFFRMENQQVVLEELKEKPWDSCAVPLFIRNLLAQAEVPAQAFRM